MSHLYTSLTRLKMEMNGGALPPMTPLSVRALKILDPEFTIGMGALVEDETLGLRCPVRGCGMWRHGLSRHLNSAHAGIGGAQAIKAALDIPQRVPLCTHQMRERRSAAARVAMTDAKREKSRQVLNRIRGRPRRRIVARDNGSMAIRNFRNTCETQLKHRFIDLQNKLGRSPSSTEFIAEYGAAILGEVRKLYGTFNNAKTHFGIEVIRQGHGMVHRLSSRTGKIVDSIAMLDSLRAWYDVHGDLPSSADAHDGKRTPFLHAIQTYKAAFKTEEWAEAMRRAAALLDIRGGRYGLPGQPYDAARLSRILTKQLADRGLSISAFRWSIVQNMGGPTRGNGIGGITALVRGQRANPAPPNLLRAVSNVLDIPLEFLISGREEAIA